MDHGKNAEFFHGRDGLSDLDDHPEVDLDSIQTEHASCAINRIVNENQGNLYFFKFLIHKCMGNTYYVQSVFSPIEGINSALIFL